MYTCNAMLYIHTKKRKLLNCLNKPENTKSQRYAVFFNSNWNKKNRAHCVRAAISPKMNRELPDVGKKLKLFKCLSMRLEVSCFCR